jgi:transposase
MIEKIMFPDEWQVQLDGYALEDPKFVFAAHLNSTQAPCTYCGCYCRRVHSHYNRQLKDLPLENQPVQLSLTVRRFFCDQIRCCQGLKHIKKIKSFTFSPPKARMRQRYIGQPFQG